MTAEPPAPQIGPTGPTGPTGSTGLTGIPDRPLAAPGLRWTRVMRAREPDGPHRASTPLELFFDLCYVVSVSLAAARLHHALGAQHVGTGLLGYLTVFFAIWWAWMNFTWFASAFDTDDTLYRLTTLVQIVGALILAAGMPAAFDTGDFTVGVIGYVIMRLAMVTQWLRAGAANPDMRAVTTRYAGGIVLLQVGWVLRLLLPTGPALVAFAVLVVGELAVPAWAERSNPTTWHPGHIEVEVATFEAWDPAGRTFDAVIAGQSWHWVDPVAGATKAAQVLRSGGPLTLFWHPLELPPAVNEAFATVYQRVVPVPDSPINAQANKPGTDVWQVMLTKGRRRHSTGWVVQRRRRCMPAIRRWRCSR